VFFKLGNQPFISLFLGTCHPPSPLFVSPSHLYAGIGTLLLTKLISVLSNPSENIEYYPNGIRGTEEKVRQVIACMAVNIDSKEGGLGLKKWYERFGFVFVGHLKEVGFKFDRW